MNAFNMLAMASVAALLTACGGSSSSNGNSGTPPPAARCDRPAGEAINHQALMGEDCKALSAYNLFADPANPTDNPHGRGLRYELTTPLFTDYASKYRFVFLPEGEAATFDEREAFDFPVGTVITKTFSMPTDTAHPGFGNERLLETRLLIHRESGWVALPYVWNEAGTEAELKVAGGPIAVSLVHNGAQRDFIYRVPDKNQCLQCHQLKESEQGGAATVMSPIGPKARLLNRDVDRGAGPQNQLAHWVAEGLLSGVPQDLSGLDTVPAYSDADAGLLAGMDDALLHRTAKGYLDINCAHCHRPLGGASNTGLKLEFWRDFDSERTAHGVCKQPVAYGGGALAFDVVPGDPDQSILHFRMDTAKAGDRMPEIGRMVVHDEGVALIREWIARMPAQSCR